MDYFYPLICMGLGIGIASLILGIMDNHFITIWASSWLTILAIACLVIYYI
jgi:hypothetical protein